MLLICIFSQPNLVQDYEEQTLFEKVSKRKVDDIFKHYQI